MDWRVWLAAVCLAAPGARVEQASAEQVSVEAASQAAGLAVATGVVTVNGVSLYYRDIAARTEPTLRPAQAVILLHGFPETGDSFAAAVPELARRYRVIVPDLRGSGLSQRPPSGYEKKTVARDVKELMDRLGIERAHVVGHDLGARVAYAFAVQYPERLLSLTVAEAFIEGLAGTADFKRLAPTNPRTRHFARFAKVDESVAEWQGREEALVLWFMNSRSKTAKFVAGDVTRYVASLKREGGLRAAFMGYEAFDRDAEFLAQADAAKLAKVPAMALACQSPAGNGLRRQLAAAGLQNLEGVILDGCAHWIYEENPDETLPVLINFLGAAHAVP
ncbi:Pimeloyl-ACP methyl ester carboxylesterase [Rhodospirillales bacterium URHD0017]|nr:Pimeloyl-ACP methyl ester carboxylesterase [Rhodospirillales bacterium URHD0017]